MSGSQKSKKPRKYWSSEARDFIINTMKEGQQALSRLFDLSPNYLPEIIHSLNDKTFHYDTYLKKVEIPVPKLAKSFPVSVSVEDFIGYHVDAGVKGQYIFNVEFPTFLFIAGIEESVHHLQYIQHPKVTSRILNFSKYHLLTPLEKVLCSHEVEARGIADSVLINEGRQPIWKRFDEYMKNNFSDKYNKPYSE